MTNNIWYFNWAFAKHENQPLVLTSGRKPRHSLCNAVDRLLQNLA